MVNRDLLTAGSVLYKAVTKDKLLKKNTFQLKCVKPFKGFSSQLLIFINLKKMSGGSNKKTARLLCRY